MISCVKCQRPDSVLKAGFVRGRQRFFCKACDYRFVLPKADQPPERRRTQTTLGDVARAVGVASSTVSRALNGRADISATTRQAILEAAQALDYQPNTLAQSLKSSATNTIGVVIPDFERPFFATVVSGIQQVADEAGYQVMICQSKESYETEVRNVRALVASRVDGLLICHSLETKNFDHVKQPADRGIPVVHFDRVSDEVNSSRVMIDDWGGAFAVTEHLLQQGCRRIAVLAGSESLLINQQRVAGYQSALKQYHIPFRSEWLCYNTFQSTLTLAALNRWLELPEPPDAIFAIRYSDAFDIMTALKRRGLRIPADVAIAGFGDEPLAGMLEPGLTTVDLHPHRIGQQAARLFLEQIQQKELFHPRTYVIQGDLIIRKSSLKDRDEVFKLGI
ncbi:transcriptional regulator, LacI family [Hymenobacter roseosalivarius DSM 11622]|uniref:Transcriptional regulator, LacI family n=1 Tax=Hymenobacter roseosalivarius DSM 11622 TaxID=645990 RepID=A0A1W1UI00_9BACT|nr:substrate-binding domain-containing protein [Hymenobacter roseosalivarius]SMB80697.1 transcriptional regulator, LacI family [Hymenobacter roseosalivarius DSM 11622]